MHQTGGCWKKRGPASFYASQRIPDGNLCPSEPLVQFSWGVWRCYHSIIYEIRPWYTEWLKIKTWQTKTFWVSGLIHTTNSFYLSCKCLQLLKTQFKSIVLKIPLQNDRFLLLSNISNPLAYNRQSCKGNE